MMMTPPHSAKHAVVDGASGCGFAPQARFPARVPGPVRPMGGWGVATPSQSRKVSAGRAGRVSAAEAELGWRTSGRLAVRMRSLGSEEPDGRPVALDIGEGVEGVAGGGVAIGLDGEQMRGNEVGAAGVAELDIGCDVVLAEGTKQVDSKGELSAQACVARGEQAAEAPELDVPARSRSGR